MPRTVFSKPPSQLTSTSDESRGSMRSSIISVTRYCLLHILFELSDFGIIRCSPLDVVRKKNLALLVFNTFHAIGITDHLRGVVAVANKELDIVFASNEIEYFRVVRCEQKDGSKWIRFA